MASFNVSILFKTPPKILDRQANRVASVDNPVAERELSEGLDFA